MNILLQQLGITWEKQNEGDKQNEEGILLVCLYIIT